MLGLREYQDEKADVIMKFTADEARVLKQYGELPEHIRYALGKELGALLTQLVVATRCAHLSEGPRREKLVVPSTKDCRYLTQIITSDKVT